MSPSTNGAQPGREVAQDEPGQASDRRRNDSVLTSLYIHQLATDGDQGASDNDQTASDEDQTASDSDQASSEADQTASDQDQLASDRESAAGADQRDRDLASDDRDHSTRIRDKRARARHRVAQSRDSSAIERDRSALERDRMTAARDGATEALDAPRAGQASDLERQRADDRERAANDRASALADRRRAAADRLRAATDRAEAVRERARARRELAKAALDLEASETDELTHVRRRGAGLEQLQREMDRARRVCESLVVGFIDVDGLKRVNDVEGHGAGDALLGAVADSLRACLRSYDLIMRFGGDEFVCVLPKVDLSTVRARFSEVSRTLAASPSHGSITVGFAQLADGDSCADLIGRADADLLAQRNRARSAVLPQAG
jgi:diguanylate cyclase (GGDEF)-like protein